MKIIHSEKYAIDHNVDVVVNSANGYLLHDSSGAGKLRTTSTKLTKKEQQQYQKLLKTLPKKIQHLYTRIPKKHKWQPTYVQLSALKILTKQQNNKIPKGAAILDSQWSKTDKSKLIHAVAMTYTLTQNDRKRVPATINSLQNALHNAINIAIKLKKKSIALPIMAARPTYGVGAKTSYQLTLKALQKLQNTSYQKVILCHDNDYSKKILEK